MRTSPYLERPASDYQSFVEAFAGKQGQEMLSRRHHTLRHLLERHLQPSEEPLADTRAAPLMVAMRNDLLAAWEYCMDRRIPAERGPETPEDFVEWFPTLIRRHETATHPLAYYLAENATAHQLGHFLAQELLVYARFTTLLTRIQVGLDADWRLACVANYWEMLGPETMDAVYTRLDNALRGAWENMTPASTLCARSNEISWHVLARRIALLATALSWGYQAMAVGLHAALALHFPPWGRSVVRGLARLGVRNIMEPISIGTQHEYGWLSYMVKTEPRLRGSLAKGAFYGLLTALDSYSNLYDRYTTGFLC